MRLFVALDLPDSILQTLEALLARLEPTARVHWSTVANLHITTKFIGEFPEERLQDLKQALQSISRTNPIPIRVEGLGWFPNPHAPRVFWAGVRGGDALQKLAHETNQALARLGVPEETRDFHPHLTLARIKDRVDLAPLRQAVAQLETVDFGPFEARSQFLYLSNNSVYTKLGEFFL